MQNTDQNAPLVEYPPTKSVVQLDLNGIYLGQTEADRCPLEGRQGIYLLPQGAVDISPPETKTGFVAQWHNQAWRYLPDYRGQTAYATEDQQPLVIEQAGEIPTGYTLVAPSSPLESWNGKEWVLSKAKAAEQLEQTRTELIQQLADKADEIKHQILVGYPQTEIDSFYRQEREAREWLADNQYDTPMLAAIADTRGIPLARLAQKVVEKADQLAAIMGEIIGTRQALESRILKAKNLEELTLCKQEIEQWQRPNP